MTILTSKPQYPATLTVARPHTAMVSGGSVEMPRPRQSDTISPRDAHALVEADDGGKWDIAVLRRDLVMKNGEIEFPLDLGGEDDCRDRLAPTPYALGQICSRLGLPASYLRKCPLVLLDQNVNYWLKAGAAQASPARASGAPAGTDAEPWDGAWSRPPFPKRPASPVRADEERWLLRARHGTLRAALSQHYSLLDNAALMDALLPVLPPHFRVQWFGLRDESFHLRLVDPTKPKAVLPGDDFFAGVHIANSEIGARSVTVDALVYRLVCRNGLIALVNGKSLLRRRHVHIDAPRFRAALEDALAQALRATDDLLAQLETSARTPVPDPDAAIDRFARLWQQSEATAEIARAALQGEPAGSQHTVYGLVNAFTHAAQLLPDEQRYDLEVLAGQLARQSDASLAPSGQERALVRHGPAPTRNPFRERTPKLPRWHRMGCCQPPNRCRHGKGWRGHKSFHRRRACLRYPP